ncbi:MAG TPA: DUF3795 domain-containing protein [Firmicutes bacterium]|nr:DUF3795 domain-containing protein [Bacillota bacterium]
MKTFCGLDCDKCELKNECCGCVETNGRPFGGSCMIAECCKDKGCENCGKFFESQCELKERLISEFNELGIEDMEKVTSLNALRGSFVNLEYTLPSSDTIKFWDDNKIYLGNQICKKGSDRCYGLTADENYLLVCEYGDGGADAEIITYKKR